MQDEVKIKQRKMPQSGASRIGRGKWVEAISKLRPGSDDMFVVPFSKLPTVYAAAKRVGAKVAVRQLSGLEEMGVWRKK